jgi:hypothetical protein
MVFHDNASTKWHPLATDEGTWNISLFYSDEIRHSLCSGSQLLSKTGRITEPEVESDANGRIRKGNHQVGPQNL